jgi:hypothetical protein
MGVGNGELLGFNFCFVHKDNELGAQFYLRNGFEHILKRDQEDEWYMQKSLVSS